MDEQSNDIPPRNLSPIENPKASKLGEYYRYIGDASSSLRTLVEKGYWSQQQATEYAQGYVACMHAFDVMKRNTLPENIVKDTPLSNTWEYPPEATTHLYGKLDHILNFDKLNKLAQDYSHKDLLKQAIAESSQAIVKLFPESAGVKADIETVYSGFWRISLSRNVKGEDFSFNLNIDTNSQDKQKRIAVLAYIPPTEILYGFQDLRSVSLMDDIITSHPRLNIHLPTGTEQRIVQRRKAESEYEEKIRQLSSTTEIQPATKVFTDGVYVSQKNIKVQKASEGPVGTTGVGPCVIVCSRGKKTLDGELIIGLAHVDAGQDARGVLTDLQSQFEKQGVSKDVTEMYLVGGWKSVDDLQRRLVALSEEFPIKGARLNMKDLNVDGGHRDYIDVVVDRDGRIFYGENGDVFKSKKNSQ